MKVISFYCWCNARRCSSKSLLRLCHHASTHVTRRGLSPSKPRHLSAHTHDTDPPHRSRPADVENRHTTRQGPPLIEHTTPLSLHRSARDARQRAEPDPHTIRGQHCFDRGVLLYASTWSVPGLAGPPKQHPPLLATPARQASAPRRARRSSRRRSSRAPALPPPPPPPPPAPAPAPLPPPQLLRCSALLSCSGRRGA